MVAIDPKAGPKAYPNACKTLCDLTSSYLPRPSVTTPSYLCILLSTLSSLQINLFFNALSAKKIQVVVFYLCFCICLKWPLSAWQTLLTLQLWLRLLCPLKPSPAPSPELWKKQQGHKQEALVEKPESKWLRGVETVIMRILVLSQMHKWQNAKWDWQDRC